GELKKPEVVCLWLGFHFGVNLVALRGNSDATDTGHVFDFRELLIKQLKTRKRVHLLFGTHQNTSFNCEMLLPTVGYVKMGPHLMGEGAIVIWVAKTGVILYIYVSNVLGD